MIGSEYEGLEVRRAFCQMCGPGKTRCATLCYLRDGVWEHVEGDPAWGNNGGAGGRSLCPKGNAAPQVVSSPIRLTRPLRRVGAKGEGRFEPVSWDEALDCIASTLLEQKERYGAKSLGILSPQFFPVLATFGRRFLNVHGSPNYLHSGICHSQRVFADQVTLGGPTHKQARSAAPKQLDKTRLLVVWGCNTEASGANQGDPRRRLDAMAAGCRVIDIRPMREPLGSQADLWLPIRPGTDCALAMSLLHLIIERGWYDREFADRWCTGFEELAARLEHCSAAWASNITGLPPSQIEEVARLLGTVKPMGIRIGNGVGDQSADGFWTVACIDLIIALTGNLGIPGGAGAGRKPPAPTVRLKPFDLLSERLRPSAEDLAHGWMPGVADLVAPETPRWFQTPATVESGPTSQYERGLMSVLTGRPYPLRAVIAQATNPLSATRDPKRVARALSALDFYVVMDVAYNPSCDYADIVLPAATDYEVGALIAEKHTRKGTLIGLSQQVAQPVGESRGDAQFYLDLACRMGYGDDFWGGSMDAYLEERLEGTGITLERLREEGAVLVPRTDGPQDPAEASEPSAPPAAPDYARLLADLPGGKIPCFNKALDGKPDVWGAGRLDGLPSYRGPAESLAGTPELASDYPLVFSDVHADGLCQHSYLSDVPWLRELEPYPWVRINPATARRYGIGEGDWVRIESPHGWVKLRAELFECIAPDVLMARRGWWQACERLGLPGYGVFDGGAEPNVLYDASTRSFDPFTSAMSKQTLVRISKDEEPGLVKGLRERRSRYEVLPAERESQRGTSALFSFDADRCIGCWSCETACKQWNRIPADQPGRRWVIERDEGEFPAARRVFISESCHHGANPPCARSCPAHAIAVNEQQVVTVDVRACIGCGICTNVCPFGAAQMADGHLDKCDGCLGVGRTPEGLPHCVAACPTGALTFTPPDTAEKDESLLALQVKLAPPAPKRA